MGAFLTAGGTSIKLSKQDWTVVGAQDIDGDGKAELLWQNNDLSSIVYWKLGATVTDSKVPVTGFFLNPLTPNQWKVSGVGDFDGDGTINLLLRNMTIGNTAVASIRNQQLTSIVSHSFTGIGANWVVEGVGDFDDDRPRYETCVILLQFGFTIVNFLLAETNQPNVVSYRVTVENSDVVP